MATLFEGMDLETTEAPMIESWAEAFTVYMEDATANSIGINVGNLRAVGGPKDLMKAAMPGLKVAWPLSLQLGFIAFWAGLVASPASFFTGATVIAPPVGLLAVAADFVLVIPFNIADDPGKPAAWDRICNGHAPAVSMGFHPLNNGGLATFPAGGFPVL